MSIKRKCLRLVFLVMLATASFASPMNPKEVEDLLQIMNETRVELSADRTNNGDGFPPTLAQRCSPGVARRGSISKRRRLDFRLDPPSRQRAEARANRAGGPFSRPPDATPNGNEFLRRLNAVKRKPGPKVRHVDTL